MDIIIHGKPLDASEHYTPGVDQSLARKIIDEFFALGAIKESEALIVDARYWRGTWSSVYTLLLSQNVKDTGGRGSYFAISLIIPQKYCCIISEVYKLLEDVVRENVLGTYLNKNLQYIVHNFENPAAFERLCSKLQTACRNFEKVYDESFKPQPNLSNDTYYSLEDADSLAFINLLKTKGRIIVTEKTETKDACLSQITKYQTAVQKAQAELQTKESEITSLKSQITQLKDAAKQASSSVDKKVMDLEKRLTTLSSEKEKLEAEKKIAEDAIQKLNHKITQASAILGVPKPLVSDERRNVSIERHHPQRKDSINIGRMLPMVNTALLLLIVFGMLMNLNGCSNDELKQAYEASKVQVDSLKNQLAKKEQELVNLRKSNETLPLVQHKNEDAGTAADTKKKTAGKTNNK